ncbi:unnamed protein product [Closterium sp. NIES-53]
MCEALDFKVTFKRAQLEDGDIVCVQCANPLAQGGAAAAAWATGRIDGSAVRYPDVPSFLEYVSNRKHTYDDVVARLAEEIGLDGPSKIRVTTHSCYSHQHVLSVARYSLPCSCRSSKEHMYDEVVERLAEELGLDDPSKIRLTTHNYNSQQSKPPAIKYRGVDSLADMLMHFNQVGE